jgi:hypothetical protein
MYLRNEVGLIKDLLSFRFALLRLHFVAKSAQGASELCVRVWVKGEKDTIFLEEIIELESWDYRRCRNPRRFYSPVINRRKYHSFCVLTENRNYVLTATGAVC